MTVADDDADEHAERALVERCRRGDEAAFRELVERYQHLVFALISRTSEHRDRVEDLAQEVFLRIHRGLPYFRGDARLSTWIYRIVLNLCAQARSGRREPSLSLDSDEVPPAAMESTGAARAFTDVEVRDSLDKALARLPAHARFLIAAHYLKGVRYEDLAEALELPLGTVKTHLHRAKKMLRHIIEHDLS